jgi:hypothetical protein
MGVDMSGVGIYKNGLGGITLHYVAFNSVGQGAAGATPGYMGSQVGGSLFYSAPSGWPINSADWQSGLNLSNGVFTCPVAGYYAMGYNGIHNGGGNIPVGFNTYGYGGFAKNGALAYFVHWNQNGGNTAWNTGGTSALFSCQAGDTLALFINRPPAPAPPADVYTYNYGLYPNTHNYVWCKLVG